MTEDLAEIKVQLRAIEGLLIAISEFLAPDTLEHIIKRGAEKADDKELRKAFSRILQRYYEPEPNYNEEEEK